MSYTTDYATSHSETYIQQVEMSIVNSAISIQNEAPATANHSARSAFALKVLGAPRVYAELMAPGFSTGGAVPQGSADSAFDTRAAAIWNAYAVAG